MSGNFCLIFSTILCAIRHATGSSLLTPPQSALLIGFERIYDLSLLANTLSDQGIDSTIIVPGSLEHEVYDNLIDVEVIKINVTGTESVSDEKRALWQCEILLTDQTVFKRLEELQPTFVIFPALRHDACLLPWVKSIQSIPVIWIGHIEDEAYAFQSTGIALPVHNGGFWSRLTANRDADTILKTTRDNYILPALRLAVKHFPSINIDMDDLYQDVRLILWGVDQILRRDYASYTDALVEVGCHHCRGPHPLPGDLQKAIIEYRMGVIVSLLDQDYESVMHDLASNLPQGRTGLAVLWKIKDMTKDDTWPENLFVNGLVDRQDFIGYTRARVLLSHCADTELLETAFHGTPVICIPRTDHEARNAHRAVDLGFARSIEEISQSFGKEIAIIVSEIHEDTSFRENARRASLMIRDRLNPASDRLIYWLGHVARTKDSGKRIIPAPYDRSKTFVEDSQFLSGFFFGSILGTALTLGYFVVRHIIAENNVRVPKGRYAR